MAARYRVDFSDGRSEYVSSADAKSFKRADLNAANRKAAQKAMAKHDNKKARPVKISCVG